MKGLRLDEPYLWQAEAFDAWVAAGHTGIVEAVTGTGKTRLALEAIAAAVADGRSVLVLVPKIDLQAQWRTTLMRAMPGSVKIGGLGDGGIDTLRTHDVVVAVVNSARADAAAATGRSLVVADECHWYAADQNYTALAAAHEWRLGLTATLERPDQLESRLIDYFGEVVYTLNYSAALSDEVIAHFQVALVEAVMSPQDQHAYRSFSDDIAKGINTLVEQHGCPREPFHEFMRAVQRLAEGTDESGRWVARRLTSAISKRRQLMALSDEKRLVVADLRDAIAASGRTIVFTESIEAADTIAADLSSVGVGAEALHSDHSRIDRRRILQSFGSGGLRAVVAPRVLDEGVDVPEADLAVVVSSSRTRRQMIQRMGRVLRRKPDDRLAQFAIVYLRDTTEDPRLGAHEAFLAEVLQECEEARTFTGSDAAHNASSYLADPPPSRTRPAPRRAGEPSRRPVTAHLDDEVDVRKMLGISRVEAARPTDHDAGRQSRPEAKMLAAATGLGPKTEPVSAQRMKIAPTRSDGPASCLSCGIAIESGRWCQSCARRLKSLGPAAAPRRRPKRTR